MKLILLIVFLGFQSICPLSANKKHCEATVEKSGLAELPLNMGCIYLMKY